MEDNQLEQEVNQSLEPTKYRIVSNKTYFADRYLQFKSTESRRNFPDIWNSHQEEVWRYVPCETSSVHDYLDEESCPTSISRGSGFVNWWHGQEDFTVIGWRAFTKKFPNIANYFEHVNALRDEYIKKEKAANNAETIYLN